METRLERLLGNLVRIPDRIDRLMDKALNTAPLCPAIITNWEEYRKIIAVFLCHIECTILGGPLQEGDTDFYFKRCNILLKRKYGDSVLQAPFEAVRTGNEGGLRALLKEVAELYSTDYTENLVGVTVESYINNRALAALQADADEYISRYGRIIPGEISEGRVGRIHFNFSKVLKQHPFIIRDLRRASGTRSG